jgi:hypothetical protein
MIPIPSSTLITVVAAKKPSVPNPRRDHRGHQRDHYHLQEIDEGVSQGFHADGDRQEERRAGDRRQQPKQETGHQPQGDGDVQLLHQSFAMLSLSRFAAMTLRWISFEPS